MNNHLCHNSGPPLEKAVQEQGNAEKEKGKHAYKYWRCEGVSLPDYPWIEENRQRQFWFACAVGVLVWLILLVLEQVEWQFSLLHFLLQDLSSATRGQQTERGVTTWMNRLPFNQKMCCLRYILNSFHRLLTVPYLPWAPLRPGTTRNNFFFAFWSLAKHLLAGLEMHVCIMFVMLLYVIFMFVEKRCKFETHVTPNHWNWSGWFEKWR